MIFENLQSQLFTFKFHWLGLKILLIREFNLSINDELSLYSQLKDHLHKNRSFWTYWFYRIKAKTGIEYKLCCQQFFDVTNITSVDKLNFMRTNWKVEHYNWPHIYFFLWEIVFSIYIRGVHSLNSTPSRITSNNYFEQNYLSIEQNIFISHSQK